MKKILLFLLCAAALLTACGKKDTNKVVIYSALEDNRNEYLSQKLSERFPEYDIHLQFMSTGNLAAKISSEGKDTDCDIVLALQTSYMEQVKEHLADLSAYSQEDYVDELKTADSKYLIWERFSGCVMTRSDMLKEKGLDVPSSYEDLLKPEYKELVSMPDPRTSSTAYIFLLNLVNEWGEDKAFEYFSDLSSNVLQFTGSGSGPVSALVQGEAAIGLGITYQPVQQINDGVPIELTYFKEGAPYDTDGYGIIEGKQQKQAVADVFDYLYSDLIREDKDLFSPEKIFKEQENSIPNYPKDIPYGNMAGSADNALKERLLDKWGAAK